MHTSRRTRKRPFKQYAPKSRKESAKQVQKTEEADRLAGQPRRIAGGIAWFRSRQAFRAASAEGLAKRIAA
jgi:hypothetical protein